MRIDKSTQFLSTLMLCSLTLSIPLGCEKEDPDLGNKQVVNELVETGTVIDFSGKSYGTVKLGSQWWMAENLATTTYSDGEDISLLSNETAWIELSGPGCCWYSNDESSNKDSYGALYNWYAINTDKLCPSGWHVPSDVEWNELIDFYRFTWPYRYRRICFNSLEWMEQQQQWRRHIWFWSPPGGIPLRKRPIQIPGRLWHLVELIHL